MIMTPEQKAKLQQLPKKPKKRCSVCDSVQSYTNPMSRCFECKNNFCFNHIIGGCIHGPKQKPDDPIRDVCSACFGKYKKI